MSLPPDITMPAPDEPLVLADGSWQMWAVRGQRGLVEPGDRRYCRHYLIDAADTLVAVHVRRDPDGPFYGWLGTSDTIPSMMHPHPSLFRMCFPYGPQAEVDRGKGEILRLTITEL